MTERVTAKAKVDFVNELSDGQVSITLLPDYDDGRNKEWAKFTPGLSVSLTVKDGEVASPFQKGRPCTIIFDFSDEENPEPVQGEEFGHKVAEYPGVPVARTDET